MNIEEIKQAKRETEARIRNELAELAERTGLHVYDIQLSHIAAGDFSAPTRKITEVRLELRIP